MHGITAFLVPGETDGLPIRRSIPVIRPKYPYEIQVDDVRVSEENVLGTVGEGLDLDEECFGETRILYAAHSLGPINQSFRMWVEWANDREVGGEPLAGRQAVQWKLAESAIDFHQAKHAVYHAAWVHDQGRDVRHLSSLAKYVATERL